MYSTLNALQVDLINLYLASFNRGPDLGGFQYWMKSISDEPTLRNTANLIFTLPTVAAIYPSSESNQDFVAAIYHNVFNKTPDAGGLAHWMQSLDAGMGRGELALDMIRAGLGAPAGTEGRDYVMQRSLVAQYGTIVQLAENHEIAPDDLTQLMSGVNGDPNSRTTPSQTAERLAGVQSTDLIKLDHLISADGYQVSGKLSHGAYGSAVATLGDLNHDGAADMIVAAPGTGDAQILYGIAGTSPANIGQSDSPGQNSLHITAGLASASTGWSVASVDDFNADGHPDIAISIPDADANTPATTSVLFGDADGKFDDKLNFNQDSFSFTGANGATVVSSAGDVNGDGIADIAIGMPDANNGEGQVVIIYGKAGIQGNFNLVNMSSNDGWMLTGAVVGDHLGASVSAAQDVNGDGMADLLIGAPGALGRGATYLMYGQKAPDSLHFDLEFFTAADGMVFKGAGSSVAAVGDMNGDGVSDMIFANPNGNTKATIVFGVAGGIPAGLAPDTVSLQQGVTITGGGSASSISVAAAGDFNGDGLADVLIGISGGPDAPGKTYLVFGDKNLPGQISLQGLYGIQGIEISAATAEDANGDMVGAAVSAAGDVNHDGYDDLLIGAPGINGGAGAAYVVYGHATTVNAGSAALVGIAETPAM
jgi:hypothetical protein